MISLLPSVTYAYPSYTCALVERTRLSHFGVVEIFRNQRRPRCTLIFELFCSRSCQGRYIVSRLQNPHFLFHQTYELLKTFVTSTEMCIEVAKCLLQILPSIYRLFTLDKSYKIIARINYPLR